MLTLTQLQARTLNSTSKPSGSPNFFVIRVQDTSSESTACPADALSCASAAVPHAATGSTRGTGSTPSISGCHSSFFGGSGAGVGSACFEAAAAVEADVALASTRGFGNAAALPRAGAFGVAATSKVSSSVGVAALISFPITLMSVTLLVSLPLTARISLETERRGKRKQ